MTQPSASSGGVVEQTVSLLGSAASYMRLPAIASTGVAAVLTSLLYFKQKALIYPSHVPANARNDVPSPKQFGLSDFEELVIPTDDGEKLAAFYIRGPRGFGYGTDACDTRTSRHARTTVIMFHGNAGNIGHRLPIARMLRHMVGCNIFMVEYRGYGSSTGEPGETGLNIDAQTALDYLRNRAETSSHKFIVYGQSLGGAVAIRVVAENQQRGDVVGLILENTFLSMRKLIPQILPPARYLTLLCHQVWPSDAVIPTITKVPILFLSGLKDEIVPPSHMRQLYDLSAAPNKIWKPLPLGDHNASVLEEGYFEAIADFVASATDEGPTEKPLI
ncbi:bem46 family protein [Ophiostoma piceae UAMH 11346]|uniref:Bem46 family protein n=1 Tax=Ophiostoma piceae (strain UAMH 11346) TaxID=1262450 RepID=S3BZS4_OPHP1|nr:bem46 family protein [Ophiostoma piceae UAMH 11346]